MTEMTISSIAKLAGVHTIENCAPEEMTSLAMEMTHAVYTHDQVYGQYCSVQEYIDCPPEHAYSYLSDIYCLEEWTYSLRKFSEPGSNGVVVASDMVGDNTKIYCQCIANPQAMTVDYHCAWDQGEHLWMIYLMRVVPAQLVLNKAGCVVLWSNCHHPFYDKNPFPEKSPKGRSIWVGDMWPYFYAGHTIEIRNLKHILEYRYKNNLSMRAPALK